MGVRQSEAAYAAPVAGVTTQAVLSCMAWHACNNCGLAWAGAKALVAETKASRSSVGECLAALRDAGYLEVFRYPNGGRGLTTEYIVMPQLDRAPAPCPSCRGKMKNPPAGGTFMEKVPAGGTFGVNLPGKVPDQGPKPTGRPVPNSQSTEQQSGVASLRATKPGLPAGANLASHPADDPEAREAARMAVEAVRGFPTPTDTSKAP